MESRWDGAGRAGTYDEAWKQLADRGEDPHGEVAFVQRFEPSHVLDAGCGTGRVAIELANRGIDVVGADLDDAMLTVAREKGPAIEWVRCDLAKLDLGRGFDVVVMAGNVVLFVEPGTEGAVVAGAARHVGPGGHLIAGFSLGRGVTADQWEGWVRDAGLDPLHRYATWQGDDWSDRSDYLVSVAQRREAVSP